MEVLLVAINYYRPHPKDDGRLYFQVVCLFTPGGVPHPADGGRGVPHPADGGGGYPIQLMMGGFPSSWWGYLGYPPQG